MDLVSLIVVVVGGGCSIGDSSAHLAVVMVMILVIVTPGVELNRVQQQQQQQIGLSKHAQHLVMYSASVLLVLYFQYHIQKHITYPRSIIYAH